MKILLIISNFMLLSIIAFISCNNTGKIAGNQINNKCYDRMCKNYDSVALQGLIEGQLIQQLSKSYSDDKGKSRIGGGEKQDALSVTFDLDKIKNLIWHMEELVCKSGCDINQELGIRFYYIKYPENLGTAEVSASLRGLSRDVANKHSLVMVPVYKSGADWYDFDFKNVGIGCKFDPIQPSLNKFKASGIISTGDNHGGVAPPPDPGIYPTNQPQ